MKMGEAGRTIYLAIIGLGGRGCGQMKTLLQMPDVKVRVVCDVYQDRIENAQTIAIGAHALRVICIGFVVSAVSVAASGALEGLGRGTASLVISLCRYTVVILPAAVVLCRAAGAVGVWHAFWVTEIVSAGVSLAAWKRSCD